MKSVIWKVYGFSIVMALIAIVPYLNMLYSGHGGIAWFILPFTFPYALLRMFIGYRRDKRLYIKFIKISVPIYLVCSLIVSFLATYSIKASLGLNVSFLDFFMFMIFPISLPYIIYIW